MDAARLKYDVETTVLLQKYAKAMPVNQPVKEWSWEQRGISNEITKYVTENWRNEWYKPFNSPPPELGK